MSDVLSTDEVLLDSWLVQDDDESDEAYAARMDVPLPFIPNFAPTYRPDLPDMTPRGEL